MPYLEEALTTLRAGSTDMAGLGQHFERLFQKALSQHDGALGNRFKHVWLWNDWPGHGFADMGIDLVAEEHDGGLCAIQCKCHEANRPVRKPAIDSFMSASEAAQFTSRLLVNTEGSSSVMLYIKDKMKSVGIRTGAITNTSRCLLNGCPILKVSVAK